MSLRDEMKCPKGKQPFYDGWPLFVPPAMLDEARKAWPETWIEPVPSISTHSEDTV